MICLRQMLSYLALLLSINAVASEKTVYDPVLRNTLFGPATYLEPGMASDSELDYNPWMANDGTSSTVLVYIHTTGSVPLGGDDGNNADGRNETIFYKRSTNFGQTWSTALPIGTGSFSDDGDDLYPSIACDQQGHYIAVWYSDQTLGGAVSGNRNILFSRSMDDGVTWSPAAPIVTSSGNIEPNISCDGNGTWIVSWSNTSGGRQIYYSRSTNNGGSWSAATLASQFGFYGASRVGYLGNNAWGIVYAGGASSSSLFNVFIVRSSNGGASFGSPVQLSNNMASHYNSDPAIGVRAGLGRIIVGWIATSNTADLSASEMTMATSDDNGVSWTGPTGVRRLVSRIGFCGNLFCDNGHELIWMFSGGATLGAGDFDILSMSSPDLQNWTDPKPISTSMLTDANGETGEYMNQAAIFYPNGRSVAVWNDRVSTTDRDLLTSTQSINAAQKWALYQ